MPNKPFSLLTELAEPPAIDDFMAWTDKSDTTESVDGTSKRNKAQYALGSQVNAQTGTSYTYLTTDFRKLVTHTNASPIAGTLPQASATFPAGWFVFVQNRGAGALTITPTTSTIDGAATLVLNQNEGALIVSDGTNYFSMRGKATGGVGGVGDVVGPSSATDHAIARFDTATGKLIQDSVVIVSDAGAITVPEIAAPSTPAAGTVHVYAKSDGHLYIKDDTGTETDLTAAGTPSIAPLVIEDANTIAQRNGANAQTLNVYRSFTDASNHTRLRVGPSGSGTTHEIAAEKAGSGSNLPIRITSHQAATGSIEYNGLALAPSNDLTQNLGSSGLAWNEVRSGTFHAMSIVQWEDGVKLTSEGTGSGNDNVLKIAGRFKNGGTFTGGNESPGTITANQNNYTRDAAYLQRWSSDASRDVTGLSMGGNIDGAAAVIVNVGSNDIVLKHQDANSTDINRFLCSTGADITLSANQAADIIYDSATQRWRVFKRN